IQNAIADELRKAGFRYTGAAASGANIRVALYRFYNTFGVHIPASSQVAEFKFKTTVTTSNGTTLFESVFNTKIKRGNLYVVNANRAKKYLNLVLSKGIEKLFSN